MVFERWRGLALLCMIARWQRPQFDHQNAAEMHRHLPLSMAAWPPLSSLTPKKDFCRAFCASMRHPLFEYHTVDLDVLV